MAVRSSRSATRPGRDSRKRPLLRLALVAVGVVLSFSAVAAFAGQASSGELLFYPCTSCHPVTLDPGTGKPSHALPNGFKGHGIVLEIHDKLGNGKAACLVCHDDPGKNPGMLKLIDGSLIDIKGDVSLVCYRCHESKYKEFKAGSHGKHKASCVAAGCHDPHTPGFIYAAPQMPFIGSGFQFQVLSERTPFSPLAQPAPKPPINPPLPYVVLIVVGLITAGGLTGKLVIGGLVR
jgi:hypothetical protein